MGGTGAGADLAGMGGTGLDGMGAQGIGAGHADATGAKDTDLAGTVSTGLPHFPQKRPFTGLPQARQTPCIGSFSPGAAT